MRFLWIFVLIALAGCTRDVPVVLPVEVEGVTLAPTTLKLALGEGKDLVAMVSPSTADNKNVSWMSSKPAVATVDGIGRVRGLSVGSATITVTTDEGGRTAKCNVEVVAPVSMTVSVDGFAGLAGSVDVPFDRIFDRVTADIKGFEWQVVGSIEASVVDGEVVLELPESISDDDLCKVARDDYRDYAGWWPAETVSDREAKVAGLGDILAWRGDVCVGRIYLSDDAGAFAYFHYADRPFELGGNNLHNPSEPDSYLYDASLAAGWNVYANVSGQRLGGNVNGMLCTTDLSAAGEFGWRFEAR